MKDIKVIITASGCPGASTLIRYFKNKVIERKINVVAVDMDHEPIGRFVSDKFYRVPAASSEEYIPAIIEVIKKESPDIFFCVSSFEVPIVSKNKEVLESFGPKVIISSPESIETAGNKYKLYTRLKDIDGINIPRFYNPKSLDEFVRYAKELGYPERRVCFKPHFAKGSRGYRVIDDSISRKELLLNYKPESTFISLEEFISIFNEEKEFPEFIIMEYIEGEEIDAMTLSFNGEVLIVTCKTREVSRAGVIMKGELVERPEIVEGCKKIIREIPLDYNNGMQFKGSYLIEINPRVSTFIYQDDLIEPYLSIKLALGEISNEKVKYYQKRIRFGRRMIRYMDQFFWDS